MKRTKSIIWGIAILALGIYFGGKALGLFSFELFFNGWWTLFIIIPSLIGLFSDKDSKFANLFMLALGAILLLASQNVFGWDIAWKVIVAALLAVIGLSIIFKNLFADKTKESKNKFTIHVNAHGIDVDKVEEAEVKESKTKKK
ncbi:hypothetical protein IKE86_02325 [Candidatus Saccharibacteria bacterium]|nr:hypothetical protein [Candidatus Saccharibacteria bacterium]